jgi:hypothetical protein
MDIYNIFYESINYDKSNFAIIVFHQFDNKCDGYHGQVIYHDLIKYYFENEIFNYHKFDNLIKMDQIDVGFYTENNKSYIDYDKVFIIGDFIDDNQQKDIMEYLKNKNCIFPDINFFGFIRRHPEYIKDYDISQESKNIDI